MSDLHGIRHLLGKNPADGIVWRQELNLPPELNRAIRTTNGN
jgi:hypothetical protein